MNGTTLETPVSVTCEGCGKTIERNDIAFVRFGQVEKRVFHAKQLCIQNT